MKSIYSSFLVALTATPAFAMVYEANDDPSSSSPKSNLRASSDRKLDDPWDGGEPLQRYPTGKVIMSRKSMKQLKAAGKSQAAAAAARAQGMAKIKKNKVTFESLGEGDFQVIELPPGQQAKEFIKNMKDSPDAELFDYLEEEFMEYPTITVPADGPQYNNQWHHGSNIMRSELAWDQTTGSPSVTVAICDTGIDLTHLDLMDNMLEGYQATTGQWQSNGGDISAVHPHGTMCAGCAAAIGNNGVGVAGVGWDFNHRVGRVTDDPGGSASSAVLADCARKMCELSDVKVASVSYSGVEGSARRSAATYCKTQGALMTNAAGNDNRDLTPFGPADDDDLIVVGASTSSNNKASFSAYGSFVDVWAPGQSVWTTTVGNSYQAVSGTSFSCPLTAGLIALIWSKNPELTPNEVETILKSSTNTDNSNINIGDVMNYGTAHGLIDSYRAVIAAGSGTPFPTNAPTTPPPTNAPTPFDGVMAVYDGSIGAPRCASTGAVCSSGNLLNGRAELGPEPNSAANTIDGCADGITGSYHGDESNDKIVVSSVDGLPLKAGSQAIIAATAWVWGATSDYADFYYTADITPPITWTFIKTVIPSATGSQTLTSDPFTLPNSAVQAVRVNFRYGGTASACPTNSGYDDTDDLVFAVEVDETSPEPSRAPTPPPVTSAPVTPAPSKAPTDQPTTSSPTDQPTDSPVTSSPTTSSPITASPTTSSPITASPTTSSPITASPTTSSPITASPTTPSPITASPSTSSPITASPTTQAPTNPEITPEPSTQAPSKAPTDQPTTSSPTDQPTDSPVTPAPSKAPITQAPSKAPITDAPTSCNLGAEGQRCNDFGSGNTGCCSGVCESFGNPARRVCLSNNGPTTPAPTPSVTQNSPEPTGSCLAKNNQCTQNDDCCTKNCKNNGRCS